MSEEDTTFVDEFEEEGHHGLGEADYVILFFIIVLFVGLICRELSKKTGFPYTPLLIIVGGILGATTVWGKITETTNSVSKIEPHAILVIFLPLLIFESSFNAHIEVLTKNFWQVMILVGPGVLMTAFMMACVIYYVLGYTEEDFTFISSLILGVILATTDPVAVVALLKELGAPLHIETLIEMESLFNDGVAMVFYIMFIDMAKGKDASVGDVISQFFQLAAGGPAIGFAFGIGALILLRLISKGMTTFISIIVLVSYTTFFVAEKFDLGVSGLLALVAAGITLNQNMKDYMTTKQKLGVSTILSYLQYVSETALFFLTGIFVGQILFRDSLSGGSTEIQGDDWWRLIVLYIFLVISRFIMMALIWPFLKIFGEGFNFKEYVVACWGGLRGALALALALMIYSDKTDRINQRTKHLILFHTTGIAALTLLINGPSCSKVLTAVNLITNGPHRLYFKRNYLKKVKEEGNIQLKSMKNSDYFDMVEWSGVDKIINLEEFDKNYETMQGEEKNQYFKTNNRLSKMKTLNLDFEQIKLEKIRYDVLRNFMAFVSKTKSSQWISSRIFNLIIDAAEESSENLDKPIDMWHAISYNMMKLKSLYYMRRLRKIPFVGYLINIWYHEEVAFIHEMIYIFCTSLTNTMTHERQFIEDMHVRNQMHHQVPKIIEELKENWHKAQQFLKTIKQVHFEVIGKLEQRKAAMKVIMCQAKMIDEHINTGYLPEKEGNEIKDHLSKKLSHLTSVFGYYKLTTMGQSVLQNAFKDVLDESELYEIIQNSVEHRYLQDHVIVQKYEASEYIYVISYGQLEEIITPILKDDSNVSDKEIRVTQGIGAISGLPFLIDESEKALYEIRALTDVIVYKIPIDDLKYKIYDNDRFEEFCYKKTLFHFLALHESNNKQASSMTKDEVNLISAEGILEHLQPFKDQEYTISCPNGGFLYEGCLQSIDDNGIKIHEMSLIPESSVQYCALEQSIVLIFQESKIGKHDKLHRMRANLNAKNDRNASRMSRMSRQYDQSKLPSRKNSILSETMLKKTATHTNTNFMLPQVQKTKKLHSNSKNKQYQEEYKENFIIKQGSGNKMKYEELKKVASSTDNLIVQPLKNYGDQDVEYQKESLSNFNDQKGGKQQSLNQFDVIKVF